MHRTRTQRIKEAFLRLSDADPAERDLILRDEARGDPDLWRAAAALLVKSEGLPNDFLEPSQEVVHAAERARTRSGDFVELSSPAGFDGAETGEVGERIGRYELVRPLGEGGFGAVWEAEQREPVHRLVALKLIKRGMDTRQIIDRFASERQSLAAMDHRCIAKMLDAGSTDDGRPYFVMEMVIGKPILAHCRDAGLSAEARLQIFELVCRAIHHAHRRGIVHRDIKPSNVLVADCDGEPTPKVIDFGIAKAMDPAAGTATGGLTRQRQLLGTPAYMAPEQISANWGPVDARSDIYALGVLLYELLTGTTPRQAGDSREPDLASIQQRIEVPLPASRRVSRLAGVPTDLDWITSKCLEAEPSRRYGSALELADDVRRFLDDAPVLAGPPDPVYRLRKFCRRNRALVTSAAALLGVVLVLGTAGFFWTTWKNRQLDASNGELRALNEEYLREKSAAERALRDVERLSDAHLLDSLLLRAEEDLWPAVPENVPAMERWIDDAEELLTRIERHRTELRAVTARALPAGSPGVSTLRRAAAPPSDRPRFGEEAESSPRDAPAKPSPPVQPPSFASTKDAWLHWLLDDLVMRLDAFRHPETGTLASVRRRLAFAQDLHRRSVTEHAAEWQAVADGIREGQTYTTLRDDGIEPQIGLVPVGRDPMSGLFEFLDLATHSGPIPRRDPQGHLPFDADTGIVLVLIPGGSFLMGAQNEDEDAPGYDPFASLAEGPVHERSVAPFLLSKFEMTQAQWMRLEDGANPSYLYAGVRAGEQRITRLNPVEQVRWGEGLRTLRKAGMTYPTEAQWEFATRAGTTTPLFYGNDGHEITTYANFADVTAKGVTLRISNHDDGYAYSAPVGSYAPNPFGLHDVYGNVAEWCLDLFYPTYGASRPLAEPLAPDDLPAARRRVTRGGAFNLLPTHTRSARRHALRGDSIRGSVGVRPARAIQ